MLHFSSGAVAGPSCACAGMPRLVFTRGKRGTAFGEFRLPLPSAGAPHRELVVTRCHKVGQ